MNTRDFIVERSLIDVVSVGKLLLLIETLSIIRGFTLERSLINVTNVGKPSGRHLKLFCI